MNKGMTIYNLHSSTEDPVKELRYWKANYYKLACAKGAFDGRNNSRGFMNGSILLSLVAHWSWTQKIFILGSSDRFYYEKKQFSFWRISNLKMLLPWLVSIISINFYFRTLCWCFRFSSCGCCRGCCCVAVTQFWGIHKANWTVINFSILHGSNQESNTMSQSIKS